MPHCERFLKSRRRLTEEDSLLFAREIFKPGPQAPSSRQKPEVRLDGHGVSTSELSLLA